MIPLAKFECQHCKAIFFSEDGKVTGCGCGKSFVEQPNGQRPRASIAARYIKE
jgi:uncharacterized Zn finger protein (UPF0148 family)